MVPSPRVALRLAPHLASKPLSCHHYRFHRFLSTKSVPPGSAYDVLGVGRDADQETLKAVYKQLVRQHAMDS